MHFRLTPNSAKTAVAGVVETADGPAIQAHVSVPPEDGAANAALERLISEWLDVPRRAVRIVAGTRSRLKHVAIDGDPETLGRQLQVRLENHHGPKAGR